MRPDNPRTQCHFSYNSDTLPAGATLSVSTLPLTHSHSLSLSSDSLSVGWAGGRGGRWWRRWRPSRRAVPAKLAGDGVCLRPTLARPTARPTTPARPYLHTLPRPASHHTSSPVPTHALPAYPLRHHTRTPALLYTVTTYWPPYHARTYCSDQSNARTPTRCPDLLYARSTTLSPLPLGPLFDAPAHQVARTPVPPRAAALTCCCPRSYARSSTHWLDLSHTRTPSTLVQPTTLPNASTPRRIKIPAFALPL